MTNTNNALDTRHEANAEFCYIFTIYEADGDKFHTDYFTLEGAQQFADVLRSDKETFTVRKQISDNTLEEVNALWARN